MRPVIALVALLFAGCDLLGPDCKVSEIRVEAGATPVFDWTESCTAALLNVFDSNGHSVWAISGRIRPRVTYGRVPRGARQHYPYQTAAQPLASGEYRVSLGVKRGSRMMGVQATFTVP
jgi:hypothetical protein